VSDDARVEQSRRLERVFVEKICADQAALCLIQLGMRLQRVFHIRGAGLEDIEQISVTAFEIVEHIPQLSCSGFRIEPKYPANDMIGPNLIGRIEVSWLRCRLEGSDDDPCRVRAQI